MEIIFLPQAHEDLKYWRIAGDKIVLEKIRNLLENIGQTPYTGIGKPEPLKHALKGMWSRRISRE